MNLLFVLGGDGYLYVWYYPVVSRITIVLLKTHQP